MFCWFGSALSIPSPQEEKWLFDLLIHIVVVPKRFSFFLVGCFMSWDGLSVSSSGLPETSWSLPACLLSAGIIDMYLPHLAIRTEFEFLGYNLYIALGGEGKISICSPCWSQTWSCFSLLNAVFISCASRPISFNYTSLFVCQGVWDRVFHVMLHTITARLVDCQRQTLDTQSLVMMLCPKPHCTLIRPLIVLDSL